MGRTLLFAAIILWVGIHEISAGSKKVTWAVKMPVTSHSAVRVSSKGWSFTHRSPSKSK